MAARPNPTPDSTASLPGDYAGPPPVLLAASSSRASARAAASIEAAGYRVAAVPFEGALDRIAIQASASAIWVEVDEDGGAELDRLLDRVDAEAGSGRFPAIVAAPLAMIDHVEARLRDQATTRIDPPLFLRGGQGRGDVIGVPLVDWSMDKNRSPTCPVLIESGLSIRRTKREIPQKSMTSGSVSSETGKEDWAMLLGNFLSMSAALAMTAGWFVITAAPAYGQSRQVVVTAPREEALPTRRVRYADLNLASQAGERTLNRRVGTAVREVCRESVGLMPPNFLDQKCRSIAWSGARPQIDRAIARAQEIAATGSSSIAAGSIAISLSR